VAAGRAAAKAAALEAFAQQGATAAKISALQASTL